MKKINPHHLTETNEHFTPPEIIVASHRTMGNIDLDPASCQSAKLWVNAKNIFTKEDDGLNQNWSGNIFLNPPGGICQNKQAIARYKVKSSQAVWLQKLNEEYKRSYVNQAIFVAFNLEINRYCQWIDKYPFCRPFKRIKYYSCDREGTIKSGQYSNIQKKWTDASPHATIIFFFPPKNNPMVAITKFKKHFKKIGVCRNGYNYI